MQTTPTAPAARAFSITASRSASNAGSARWAWLSRNAVMKARTAARGGGSERSSSRTDGRRPFAPPLFGEGAGRSLLVGRSRAGPAVLDVEQDRAGDVDRAERSGEDTERHDPGERANDFTGKEEQRQRGGEDRGV